MTNRNRNMVLGALTADAASLGLHWIYDQPRITALAGDRPEFRRTVEQDYVGVPSYFAHPMKEPGDLSQYGEQVMVMLRALNSADRIYDQGAYNAAFTAHFGYGGPYVGYIDKATRKTLDNLARGDATRPNGAEDTQLPAIAKLPALIAAGQEHAALDAIRSTNDTDIAEAYGMVATAMLCAARDGQEIEAIAQSGLNAANSTIRPALQDACAARQTTTEDLTAQIGMSCELAYGLPSVMHNMLTAADFEDAVRRNILAGGDSCGRAVLLGGILGAVHGVPDEWAKRLSGFDQVNSLLDDLNL